MNFALLDTCDPEHPDAGGPIPQFENFESFFYKEQNVVSLKQFIVARGDFPTEGEAFDGYIITGSPCGVYEQLDWMVELGELTKEQVPVVGICFGHQLLAHAFGGKVEKSPKGRGLGLRSIDIVQGREWMEPFKSSVSMYFSHQDQVVELPSGAELLATSAFCPNEMFQLGPRVLGMQGHPEFKRASAVEAIERHQALVSEETAALALSSIDETSPDSELLARWIRNFLQY